MEEEYQEKNPMVCKVEIIFGDPKNVKFFDDVQQLWKLRLSKNIPLVLRIGQEMIEDGQVDQDGLVQFFDGQLVLDRQAIKYQRFALYKRSEDEWPEIEFVNPQPQDLERVISTKEGHQYQVTHNNGTKNTLVIVNGMSGLLQSWETKIIQEDMSMCFAPLDEE
jgi:hypothetical protein